MFDRAAWMRILPFGAYLSFLLINDLLQRLGWDGQSLRWLYAIKIGVVVALLAVFWRHYGELARPRLGARAALLAVVCGIVVLVLWIRLDASWMRLGTAAGFDPRNAGQIDWALVSVRVAGAALVVPLMEELFWRSFLLRFLDKPDFLALDPRAITLRALAISSVLFGIEHSEWLAGIVAGLAYGALYWHTRELWAVILAHAVTNGVLAGWIIVTGNWSYW